MSARQIDLSGNRSEAPILAVCNIRIFSDIAVMLCSGDISYITFSRSSFTARMRCFTAGYNISSVFCCMETRSDV